MTGHLQVPRDGGKTWTNVGASITGLPKTRGSRPSSGALRERNDLRHVRPAHLRDMRPYAYKSTDFGATWTPLVAAGQPRCAATHTSLGRPGQRQSVFLGTELGCGSRGRAGSNGRTTRAAITGRRGARSRPFTRATTTSSSPHTSRDLDRGRHLAARALTPEVLGQPVAFLPGRPTAQRLQAVVAGPMAMPCTWERSAQRRRDHLLPAAAPHLRRYEARSVRRER